MRLGREGAERHRSAREAAHDVGDRLDLVDRHWRPGGDELEQVARLERRAVVDERGEALVEIPAAVRHGLAQVVRRPDLVDRRDDVRRDRVRLAALAELHVAGVLELGARLRGRVQAGEPFGLELGEADPAEVRGRARECELDHLLREPDRVEDLRAAVARHVGDAHLGHDLEDPVLHGLAKATLGLVRRGVVAADLVRRRERRHRLEDEHRADRVGAVAEQRGEVVGLARLVALDEQRGARAQPLGDQALVDGADGEQARDRRPAVLPAVVAESQQLRPGGDGGDGLGTQALTGAAQALGSVERRVEPGRVQLRQGRGVEEEALQLEQPRRLGALGEQRGPGAEQRPQRHDEPLPQVVDGRVRHLRKALPEVARKRTGAAGERRQRGVVAHGRDGVVPARPDRPQDQRELLACVAGGHLAGRQVSLRRRDRLAGGDVANALGQPLPVGAAPREVDLDSRARLDAAARVDREHLVRPELPAHDLAALGQRHDARLGRAGDEAALDDRVAERPQPVAVEGRTDDPAVREDDPGRAVPRLHQTRVVAVEVPDLLRHDRVELPGLGDEHGDRVAHVAAAADDRLQGVVEDRRVRTGLVQWERVEQGVVEAEVSGARAHPVHVPAHRVDLAVVAEEPERLRALPGRSGVRREALVEDPERHGERRVAQVGVEVREVVGRAERLVRDRAEGERGHVRARHGLGTPARAIRAELERVVVEPLRAKEDELLDHGQTRPASSPSASGATGTGRQPRKLEPLGAARILDSRARSLVPQEDHREPAARLGPERVRQRQEDARAVARQPVGGRGASVAHVPKPGEQQIDDLAGRTPRRVGDEPDPAGIALDVRVVQELSWAQSISKVCDGQPPPLLVS